MAANGTAPMTLAQMLAAIVAATHAAVQVLLARRLAASAVIAHTGALAAGYMASGDAAHTARTAEAGSQGSACACWHNRCWLHDERRYCTHHARSSGAASLQAGSQRTDSSCWRTCCWLHGELKCSTQLRCCGLAGSQPTQSLRVLAHPRLAIGRAEILTDNTHFSGAAGSRAGSQRSDRAYIGALAADYMASGDAARTMRTALAGRQGSARACWRNRWWSHGELRH